MLQRFRIYTENKPNVASLVGDYFPAFTLFDASGYWKGQKESSSVIEIMTEDQSKVKALAERIKLENSQEAILITADKVEEEIV